MKTIFKKIVFSFLISITISFSTFGQDIIKIENQFYTSWFSKSEHIPLVLTYNLTKSMVNCTDALERTNKFKPDPQYSNITSVAKDYRNSGFDRGHNMSAADNQCNDTGMDECFYYSNMTPQPHSFNAGRWEDLEKIERTEATQYNKIIVTVGSVGISERIGVDNVVVPKYMWKVIYIPTTKKYECYIFPDTDNVTKSLSSYKVTKAQIENLGSVTFTKGVVELETE